MLLLTFARAKLLWCRAGDLQMNGHQPHSPHYKGKAVHHAIPHFHVICLGFSHLGEPPRKDSPLPPPCHSLNPCFSPFIKGLLTLALHHVFLDASWCFSLCLSEAIYPTSSTALHHDKETAMAAADSVPL
jgi:hypothetical protein